jgi:hypothetical protein
MPINTYRAKCRFCAKPVGVRKGRADKSPTTGYWLISHHQCHEKHAPVKRPPPAPAAVYRPPYADD